MATRLMATRIKEVPESQELRVARLVRAARDKGEPDAFSGKRRWVRYNLPMRLEVTTQPDDPSATWSVTMHNMSGGGFGFWSKQTVDDGTPILVRQWTHGEGAGADAGWIRAHVTHCTIGIRGHLVGAIFDHPFSPDHGDDGSSSAAAKEESAPRRATRPQPPLFSLQTKCAVGSALSGGLGALVAGVACRMIWPVSVSPIFVSTAVLFALIFGGLVARLLVQGELRFLEALRTGIRQIAAREPIAMQLAAAPSRDMAALGQAFLDLGATWQKHQEDERLARQKLEELNQIKSNILSIVSHDLRTPLTSILLYTQMLAEELDTLEEEDQRRFLSIIFEECTRLARLVDDLLEIQRLEAGRVRWDMQSRDISETIRSCARLFDAMALSKNMVFTMDCPSTLPPVEADADKISQVLSNLLSNAMKYTPAGGRIRLSAQAGGKDITLSVADNGPGIPRDKWDQIFDRFAQLANPNVREIAGCGLGLYIVRQIVERHGGAVWVDSEVGCGSEFFVSLPTKAPRSSPEAAAGTSPSAGTVVVCDADPELAAMISQTLRQEKYEVRQAHSGLRLLAQLEHGDADVVVTDVLMPDMNADELLDQLTSLRGTGHGLVVHSYAGEGPELRRRGVDVFLRRPASKEDLIRAVSVAIAPRRSAGRAALLVVLLEAGQTDMRKFRRLFADAGQTPLMAENPAAAAILLSDYTIDVVVACGGGLSADWRELGELGLRSRSDLHVVVLCEYVRQQERKQAETDGVSVIACRKGHEEDVVAAIVAAHKARSKERVT